MKATPIKTRKVKVGAVDIFGLLDESLSSLPEASVLAISSKVVSICEGRVIPIGSVDKEKLIKQEASYYLGEHTNLYGHHFTITQNTLISSAGIDESNADGHYVLWPADSQKSANAIRVYLAKRFGLKKLGVIITDSTVYPLRYGTVGVVLAHSGFLATNDYRGKPDLFDRPFNLSRAGVASGLAGTACLVMGEGREQTPLVILADLPFVNFQPRNPTKDELELFYIKDRDEDMFAPFLNSVTWHKGSSQK
jgi:F420-0:gamma-glutamyl ligase